MTAPKVTVIIPTYDRARYLGDAIRSVLAQTVTDFELIVVDDGSTDDTAAVLAQCPDPRLRCVRQEHRGISAAMNAGMRAARGGYLARLDSDDTWHADMLQTLTAMLDAHSDIGVVYGVAQATDATGAVLPNTQGMPPRFPSDCLKSMLYDDFTCNIALVARRECFERAGMYDESLRANEDWDMWLRVAQHHRFAFADRVLANFRWHGGNLTALGSPLFPTVLATRTRPLDKFFSQADLPADVIAMRPVAYTNVHLFCGLRWLQARELGNARREFARALHASGSPLRTAVRIAWFVLVNECLHRFAAGRRFTVWLTSLRRRWFREAVAGDARG